MTKRASMHAARKRRIHDREGGVCWICKQPVPMAGPEVRYDHRGVLWITGDDADAAIYPIHRKGCDETKTPKDLKRVAKTKRQIKMRLDVPIEESRHKIKGRGFQPGHRALRSKSTFATRKRS